MQSLADGQQSSREPATFSRVTPENNVGGSPVAPEERILEWVSYATRPGRGCLCISEDIKGNCKLG